MNWSYWTLNMKKMINTKFISYLLASIFALTLSFSVNAENTKLQEAKEEIIRFEMENKFLQEELRLYEKHIAKHKKKLAEYDNMEMNTEE